MRSKYEWVGTAESTAPTLHGWKRQTLTYFFKINGYLLNYMIRLNSMNHSPFKKFSTVLHHASTDMHCRVRYMLNGEVSKTKKVKKRNDIEVVRLTTDSKGPCLNLS